MQFLLFELNVYEFIAKIQSLLKMKIHYNK